MIRLAIVGTGGMSGCHADQFSRIKGCRVVAACDVNRARLEAFSAKHGVADIYDDVDEMLAKARIDAISNVTPDAFHAPISLKAIAKGKHVLCEKPLATDYAAALKMATAAKRKGVINMVNFSYRENSSIQKARDIVQQGQIGRVIHFEASYLQSWLTSIHWGDWQTSPGWLWRLSKKHGSKGVLGDLGVHIVDFATFPAGDVKSVSCRLKTFTKVKGNKIGPYKLDANDSAVMTLELANGAIGTIHTTRWATGQVNSLRLRIYGDKGGLIVDLDESGNSLKICRGKDVNKVQWKTVKCGRTLNIYQRFIKSIRTGKNDQPDFTRGAAVQKVLDACFVSDKTGKVVELFSASRTSKATR